MRWPYIIATFCIGYWLFFVVFDARSNRPQMVPSNTTAPPPASISISKISTSNDNSHGRELFRVNCARCHAMKLERISTGPALHGVSSRIPPGDWIYPYIKESGKMVEEGDPYAVWLWEQNGRALMDPMPHLSHADIDSIMAWIDGYVPMGPVPMPASHSL